MDKKGNINQLPGFFQVIMLVVIFVGLTFIILAKFADVTTRDTTSVSVINETGAYVNATLYTVDAVSTAYIPTNFALTNLYNATSNLAIELGNATMSSAGVMNGTGAEVWDDVLVSYTYDTPSHTITHQAVNGTTSDLYDYGVGFLGLIILVVMVYLIIQIIGGRKGVR